jgi:tetratricopeptide (TPR) repeat protein
LIGVGTFEDDGSFVVRQFFLRSPAEEPAVLLYLSEWLDEYEAVVSFNGRGFDLPILQTRFILQRLRPHILSAPHLDLLTPARRVWRGRLESCSLKSLEYYVLGVQRDQIDIDGSLIPQLYIDYQRTGDASEMPRVLYHNAYDILSMVTLATQLIQIFDEERAASLTAAELYILGKWHADRAEHAQAERYLQQALEDLSDIIVHHQAAMRLSLVYKQLDRRADAIGLWEAVAQTSQPDSISAIEACIELAKYYEWHDVNLPQALAWTEQALSIAKSMPDRLTRREVLSEVQHRQQRLVRKIDRHTS